MHGGGSVSVASWFPPAPDVDSLNCRTIRANRGELSATVCVSWHVQRLFPETTLVEISAKWELVGEGFRTNEIQVAREHVHPKRAWRNATHDVYTWLRRNGFTRAEEVSA